ncbi:MAG: hypothetical protein WCR30_04370 [Clostridia bacterium]
MRNLHVQRNRKDRTAGFHIDHALFRLIDEERRKIHFITKLFEPSELNIRCVFCDEEDEKFIAEIKHIETIKIDSLIKKKRVVLFGKPQYYYQVTVSFIGKMLGEFIDLAYKYDNELDMQCFDNQGKLVFWMLVNGADGNDGSIIGFSTDRYDYEHIVASVKEIVHS